MSDNFGFTSTTHDRSIYHTTWNGERVFLLRQVDNFALACPREDLAIDIYTKLGKCLKFPNESEVPFKYLGLLDDFNGIDIGQYANSTVLSCTKYIERVCKTHKWSTTSPTTRRRKAAPLPTDAINTIYSHSGPSEGTREHLDLQDSQGFKYRTLLGEVLYAYVTCRPDIGYAVIASSKFSTSPHKVHFSLLKKAALYLRDTKHWEIIYQRGERDDSLPESPHNLVSADPDLPDFPMIPHMELTAFVNAAHANDLRKRRSTTGYAFILAGGDVSYRCKTQSITATSSTEAEFWPPSQLPNKPAICELF